MRIENILVEATLSIRHRVLWPDKPIEHCKVEGDEHANHYGVFCGNLLVGVASTYTDGQAVRLRKFAVETAHQGKGFGAALLTHAIEQAKAEGATIFWCDARESAVPFYENFGLTVDGEIFYKSRLAYFKMSIDL